MEVFREAWRTDTCSCRLPGDLVGGGCSRVAPEVGAIISPLERKGQAAGASSSVQLFNLFS